MKKFLIVLLVLLTIAGCAGTGYFYYQYTTSVKEKNTLVQQNGELQASIDAIGPMTTAYTVKANVFVGKEVKAEDFIEDVLYGMGYKWNQDGTVTKINKTN